MTQCQSCVCMVIPCNILQQKWRLRLDIGFRLQRVKVAIAPSLPVDVLLGWDIFCPEVGQQLGPGLAVVSQAR